MNYPGATNCLVDSFYYLRLDLWIASHIEFTSDLQYSSQVTSPAGTREYHNGAPHEAPMLTCLAQDLRVTA